MMPAPTLALCLLAATALSCHHLVGDAVVGDGHKTTEARAVSAFSSIRLEGPLDAEVKVGAPVSVAVTIDANLQPQVEARVEGETLVIRIRRSISYRGVGKVQIGVPTLHALSESGSGNVVVDGSSGGDLRLAVSGSGNVRWNGGEAATVRAEISGSGELLLAGKATTLEATLSGSGNVRAAALSATNARVRVSGSGGAELTLRGGTLDAVVSGSGDVRWSGEAKSVQSSVSGSGRIASTGGSAAPAQAESDDDEP